MCNVKQVATVTVLVHAAITVLHGLPHAEIPVPNSPEQGVFIALVIGLAPFVALGLLWSRFRQFGAALLLGSMASSLAFGAYNHFIALSPDHVSQVPASGWGLLFQLTAGLLLLSEGAGCLVGLWIVNRLRQASAARPGMARAW